ncbi:MAG: hypothetical protein AAAC47_11460 [Pararhizobium sp.]
MALPFTAHKTSIVRRNSEGFLQFRLFPRKIGADRSNSRRLAGFRGIFRNYTNRLNSDEWACMPVYADLSVIMHDMAEPCRQNYFFYNVNG